MHIRDAVATDAKACAPLIYSSAAQKYDYGIGAFSNDPTDVIEDAFRHYALVFHKVVEIDSQVVGIAAFHTNKDARKVALKVMRWAVRYYGVFKLPKLTARLLKLTQMQAPADDDTLYITNIAVIPEMRGQGIATALIECFASEAKRKNLKYGLDVAVTNTNAIKLYEQLGFEYQWKKSFTGSAAHNIGDSCRYIRQD